MTEANRGNAPRFRPSLERTTADFDVRRVLGDKAYSSYAKMDFATDKAVTPFVMVRDNASDNTGCEAWDKLLHFYKFHKQELLRAYHKRSNVESTFSAIKRVFGDFVRSRGKVAQVNEVLRKTLCHNIRQVIFAMHELGIAPTLSAEIAVAPEGKQVTLLVQSRSPGFAQKPRAGSESLSASESLPVRQDQLSLARRSRYRFRPRPR